MAMSDGHGWDVGSAVDAVLGGAASEDVSVDQVATALRLLGEHRERVDRVEVALMDAVLAKGWTWEQLGAAMGKRSKQAAQQHAKRLRTRSIASTVGATSEAVVEVPVVATPAETPTQAPIAVAVVDSPTVVPQQPELAPQRQISAIEESADPVRPVRWRQRGRGAPYTGPSRFDPTVPATSCPTCDFSPAAQSLRGRLREDLKVTWLEVDAAGDLVERAHCERCQPRAPRHRIADLSCVKCGEGPLLVGSFADAWAEEHKIAPAVAEWLTGRGWREGPHGMMCGDHG